MRKTPNVNDYGGYAYGRRRSTARTKDTTISMRCTDCGKLRYVTQRELDRAARPRCIGCGGPITEISVSRERREVDDTPLYRQPTGRCFACGASLGMVAQKIPLELATHLSSPDHTDCAAEYVKNRKTITTIKGLVLIGLTAYVARKAANKWQVVAVGGDGKLAEVGCYKSQYDADERVHQLELSYLAKLPIKPDGAS